MNYQRLVGQFVQDPRVNRVFVESVGPAGRGLPDRTIVRTIEGENKNARLQWWAHLLKPLGPEIPIIKPN
jgi:hypothetical protein